MAVTANTVLKDAWNILYQIISGNVADPVSRGGSAWIFSSFPAIQEGKEDDFPGYPIITIESFQPDSSVLTQGAGYMSNKLNTEITVFSQSKQQLDNVANDVFESLFDNRNVLAGSGLYNLTITPLGTDTDVISRNNKIHSWMIGVGLDTDLI